MSRKRESAALSQILADPGNSDRTAEEIAELCIDALDEARGRTHRLLVVGQIQHHEAPGNHHTVALGPFSARGVLDSPEKFERATGGGSAAREAGRGLAWDSKTGKGKGRFMLVPCFRTSRDAYDFFRESGPSKPEWREIGDAISRDIEPACSCGLTKTFPCPQCGRESEHYCHRHSKGAAHDCKELA